MEPLLVIELPYGARLVVRLDVEGSIRWASGMEDRLDRLRPLLERLSALLRQAFKNNFQAQGRPDHWAPLAPSTVKKKARQGKSSNKTLRRLAEAGAFGSFGAETILIGGGPRGGYMRDSFVQRGAPDHVSIIDEQAGTVEEGSSVYYAHYHQTGTDHMPSRPQELTDSDLEAMLTALVEHLEGAVSPGVGA